MMTPAVNRTIECPACSSCGGSMRIYGIEPYAGTPSTDVLTYVCESCEALEVRIAPAIAPAQ